MKISIMFDERAKRQWDTREEEWLGDAPALNVDDAEDFWLTVGLNLTDGRKSGHYGGIGWAIVPVDEKPVDYRWLGLGFI